MATDEQRAPGGRWLCAAFLAWIVGGLFTGQVVELMCSRLGAPFPLWLRLRAPRPTTPCAPAAAAPT